MAEQTVTLNPNESKVVSFEATPNEAKTYNVSVNGLTGSFKAITAVGMITLYMAGVSTQEWMASWYYADRDKFIANPEFTTPSGYPTGWARPSQPCHPPEPIDLNNLIVKIDTYSEVTICPKTGHHGTCRWGVFGPFVVEDGGVYTINIATGALSKR